MNLANWISIFRILMVPVFIGTIVYYDPQREYLRSAALLIFFLAVISDGVDGFIARTRSQKTRLGSFLDPMADKLLLSSSFITLALAHNLQFDIRLPLWIPILVISRDVILALGSFLIFIITQDLKIVPSLLGKATTFFQMTSIIAVLLQWRFSPLLWNTAAFFTVVSGFDYILRGTRLLGAYNAHNHNSLRKEKNEKYS